MVQLGSVHHYDGQADMLVSLCSLALLLCLVVVALGIKLFWFKRRLDFEHIPTGTGSSDNSVVLTRSSRNSQEQIREPVVVQGIFRRRLEEDVIIDRPNTLPPIRIRKTSNRPLSFVPPKRNETPCPIVNEPVVIPPPPPPLPSSASMPSLQHTESTTVFEKIQIQPKDTKPPSTNLVNGNGIKMYEQLKNGEKEYDNPYKKRRPTGYVRPSSDELVQEVESVDREPPQIQPRSTIKETFKKNPLRGSLIAVEPLKDEEDYDNRGKLGQRRLTGFFPPESEAKDSDVTVQPRNKVAFAISDDDDEDDDDENDNKSSIPPSPPLSPSPILLNTQLSTDNESNPSDSWSSIQRHRNLAQEITERHEAMQNRKRKENTDESISEFQNPLAAQPRTMRDMKRNNARNDLLIDIDRDATEA